MTTFQKPRASERMLSVEEAQERVLAETALLGTETIELHDALGRILREDVRAPRDVPSADNSAMDGYAVVAGDLEGASDASPVPLRVVEDVPAGRVAAMRVGPGTAIRIMTGALIPGGADAVVPVELTDGASDVVRVSAPVKSGANVRARGEDMREGAVVLGAGTRLGAGEIGVLASVQKPRVEASRRPEIAILSTGDEVVPIDGAWEPGKVVNSNSWSLAALARQAGALPRMMGIVPDDLAATKEAIRAASSSDFILSSGGVSVGAYDFVKDALDELGAETRFWQVAMKPGKPLVFARLGETLYFGLPGTPVSCMVSFLLFIVPAIRKAMGESGILTPPSIRATLDAPLRSRGDRRQYFRARAAAKEGRLVVTPMTGQGSGQSTGMIGANAFAVVDPGTHELAAGDEVEIVLFGQLEAS
ncbi:MAG TPA: gephyrin-like molybdotransferase Glp [Thermoanaerobaculia bacterium]